MRRSQLIAWAVVTLFLAKFALTSHFSPAVAQDVDRPPAKRQSESGSQKEKTSSSPESEKNVKLQLETPRTINIPYEYPVVPGTAEWKRRVKSELPWDLCQIPQDVLTNLSDSALLTTVLRYPMRGDIYAFDTLEKGLEVSIKRFNGLPELFSRARVPALLTKHFQTMNVDDLTVEKISNENRGFMDLGYVSSLIRHPKMFERFTDSERVALCTKALLLQAEYRDRVGESPGEVPAAQVAASMLGSGIEVRTQKGVIRASDMPGFTTFLGPQAGVSNELLDFLYSVGRQLKSVNSL